MSGFIQRLKAAFGLGRPSASASRTEPTLAELRAAVSALFDEQLRDYERRAADPAYAAIAQDVLLGVTYAQSALARVDAVASAARPKRWLTLLLRAFDESLEELRKNAVDEYGYASATLQELRAKSAELLGGERSRAE